MSWVGRFCCKELFRALRWFPHQYQRQFDARRVFSLETESFHSFWEQISISRQACGKTCPCMTAVFGCGSWGASVVILEGTIHTCRAGKGRKPDIIDYFLVSTLIRPLTQKCEIVKSVPWGPHYGVKLALNIKFGLVVSRQLIGKFSKRNRHNTNALQGQKTQHTEDADPALWNEARRNCVFEGKKPRCQDGQEDTQAACSQFAHACGFGEEADELGHALGTWSDATTQHLVRVGRKSQIPLSGEFATFRVKPLCQEKHSCRLDASFWRVEAVPN